MKRCVLTAAAMAFCCCGIVLGAPTSNVLQYPTGYFVPDSALTYSSPYYRWYDEDWSWTHDPIAGPFTSAELYISAWDVDWSWGEVDVISVYDAASASWTTLGSLTGMNDSWSYAVFPLSSVLYDDIQAGLQVHMDIDSTHTSSTWAVTLAKSVLSVDGGNVPNPAPNATVPEPTSLSLIGIGIWGLARLRKALHS